MPDLRSEADALIAKLRQDQRAQVHTSEDAAIVEIHAQAVAARAHAIIEGCRQRLREDADEIERLQAER